MKHLVAAAPDQAYTVYLIKSKHIAHISGGSRKSGRYIGAEEER